MKTREQVEALKRSWYDDPIWDIEDTEGFSDYYGELKQYRLICEKSWADRRKEEIKSKAYELGIPGNVKLAEYILELERKLRNLVSTNEFLMEKVWYLENSNK